MSEIAQRGVSLELRLRRSAPSVARARQEAVRARVESLAETGHVRDASVGYWSRRVCVRDGDEGGAGRCPGVVDEVLDAAADAGLCVEPYFRRAPASYDGEDVLFLPVICLLVRRDGDLCGVYPATDGGTAVTVEDALERLAAGDSIENL